MTQNLTITRLMTDKVALNNSRIDQVSIAPVLGDGEVMLKIERAAITTNNITYAAFGDSMQYWDFFPTGDADWGHMPVWGFARVIESGAAGVETGELFYGYLPIASHIRMQAERVSERGFFDGSEHRRTLVSAYNQYTRCSRDPAYREGGENYQMLVRPLFTTSFMCADFLKDNGFFGARQIVVASASSKTAYGTAYCLQDDPNVNLIALTSARNQVFVAGLGCYREVQSYEHAGQIDPSVPTLYLDFSGDNNLRVTTHRHFGAALVYDCYVGSTQNARFLEKTALPGPEPRFFFTPIQIKKRNVDWGHDEVTRRINEAQMRFISEISRPGAEWMKVMEHTGYRAAAALIEQMQCGRIDPRVGHAVLLC